MTTDIRDTPAAALIQSKKFVVSCAPEATLEEALEAMHEVNVSGLPVFHPDEGYLGFVSSFDIMTYIAFFSHFKEEVPDSATPRFARLGNRVRDVLDISAENKSEMWKAYASDETLGSIAGRMESGIHRMLIAVDDRAKLLTQTDVIKYIHSKDKTNPLMKKTLSELGIGHVDKEVTQIRDTTTALQGFRTLYQKKITAAPIVDKNGAVIGTLSASDVRGLRSNNTSDVMLPVLKYLEKKSSLRSQVSVTKTSKLDDVFRRMIDARVHRVWIVNAERKPIGVISMSDVIGLYFK